MLEHNATELATFGAPQCVHIKPNGARCRLAAIRGERHCHFHAKTETPYRQLPKPAGHSNRRSSMVHAIAQVTRLLANGQLDTESTGIILYGLQLATIQLKQSLRPASTPTSVEAPPPG